MTNLANRIKSVEQTIVAKTGSDDTDSAGVKALRMIINIGRSIHQNLNIHQRRKIKSQWMNGSCTGKKTFCLLKEEDGMSKIRKKDFRNVQYKSFE